MTNAIGGDRSPRPRSGACGRSSPKSLTASTRPDPSFQSRARKWQSDIFQDIAEMTG